ncbi:hypothetical protein AURANDRAFT_69003 [Aureococcus anophagefferens]|uniref:Beta-lactamase-related domain-containing protein n=1 Tax=Aureococcus anophagefferens TaxID=44056 RepID=F0YRF4_AURAN|nr:hypothetical protein AURANDRAFT_69003 [Aureococcus anophagefferens]EGB02305.1 hypothetical protein AURANDRAFT_69003 [Aureococcus anophagefferens]|eukprot:XP_009042996.1 hypothetical protein AURANDRAFT_69003 [Aureococcus anophagefferens]
MLVGRSFAVAGTSLRRASAARGLASLEYAVEALLGTYGVAGVSAAVLAPDGSGGAVVRPVVGGLASRARREPVAPGTLFQIASLSKPVATAFAIDFFEARGACFETATVNGLLAACGSPFRLRSAAGAPRAWAEAVTLAQLVDHSALGMHYVPGVPRSAPFPDALALVSGSDAAPAPHGYASLDVDRAPGTRFAYSGGGFLPPAAAAVADGHDDAGNAVPGGRLNFPPCAAGALGSAGGLGAWLGDLAAAFRRPGGAGAVSAAAARSMLADRPDLGSRAFMRARVGRGVFLFDAASRDAARPNRWMLHQAANDGFRGFFLVCFDGPSADGGPAGLVVLCNGDNGGVLFNCAVARALLASEDAFPGGVPGLDWSRVPDLADGFDYAGLRQEEIVNLGLRDLVLNAFVDP